MREGGSLEAVPFVSILDSAQWVLEACRMQQDGCCCSSQFCERGSEWERMVCSAKNGEMQNRPLYTLVVVHLDWHVLLLR